MGLLDKLPTPPPGRTGWPWTEETPPLPPTAPGGTDWPRITIVTPAFGQGHLIEETIRSILLQNYPNLDYFVMDGGSTDSTVDVLRKYEPWLKGWLSEKDRGQTHAINKGFERAAFATGDIHAYLNSDDWYLPGTFRAVAEAWAADPSIGLLHGLCELRDDDRKLLRTQIGNIHSVDEVLDLWGVWWGKRQFVQPEVFWSAELAKKIGPFREDLYFVMDYEYWARLIMAGAKVHTLDRPLTVFRITPNQKSKHSKRVAQELLAVVRPWLWDPSVPLSPPVRRRLKAAWNYERLRGLIDESAAAGEGKARRWSRLARFLAAHPNTLSARGFWNRFRAVAR